VEVLQGDDIPVSDTICKYTPVMASVPYTSVVAIPANTKRKGDFCYPCFYFFVTKAYPPQIFRGLGSIFSFPKR
jgi:hypothetical protein